MKTVTEFSDPIIIEIITVGSELLTPYSLDTNSFYITKHLNDLGREITYKTTVGDDWKYLLSALQVSLSRANLIIATGGLGPTNDDNTREAFAEALNRNLILNKDLLDKIRLRFKRRGLKMPAVNEKQANVIEGAEVLENNNGTAPGIWLETETNTVVLLPGPPNELEPMFEKSVWPRLKRKGHFFLFRQEIKMAGTTESEVETHISNLYEEISDVRISTLASPGQIEIHLSASSKKSIKEAEGKVKKAKRMIVEKLKENVFSTSGEELEEIVGKLLTKRKETAAVAESCTGGLLSNRITNVPGSSDYFLGGIVAYSNEAKIQNLEVSSNLIIKHGAVSAQVARAMAEGVRKRSSSTYGIGITGIAGPSGGSPQKPVGLVYIALASETSTEHTKNIFLGNREKIKYQSSQKALDMLRKFLLRSESKKKEE